MVDAAPPRALAKTAGNIGLALILQMFASIAATLTVFWSSGGKASLTSGLPSLLENLAVYLLSMVVGIITLACLLRKNLMRTIPFRPVRHAARLPKWLAAALGASFLASLVLWVLNAAGVSLKSNTIAFPNTPGAAAVYLLLFCVAAPVMEECLFRGLIFQSLRRYGERFAILFSALLFALTHANLAQLPLTFLLGLVLAGAVMVFDSIFASMLLHAAVNGLSALVLFLEKSCGMVAGQTVFVLMGALSLCIVAVALLRAWKSGKLRAFIEHRPVSPYPMRALLRSAEMVPGMYAFTVTSVLFMLLSCLNG